MSNSAAPGDDRPDLTGRILNQEGVPIHNATIFIYTAGPKVGTANLCPSCYPDCRKKAETDSEGSFKVASLDTRLIFRLLIVAKGYEALFISKVDPALGPRQITIKRYDSASARFKSHIAGIVLDASGRPVSGAVLDLQGVSRGSGGFWGNVEKESDAVAVTDQKGRFVLHCNEGITSLHAIVEARGLAKRWVNLVPGSDALVLMEEGATITGRLVLNDHSVKNAVVGLITREHEAGKCLSGFETTTDPRGTFTVLNVPSGRDFACFARMDSLPENSTLPIKSFKTTANGGNVALGDLPLAKGYRVAGRISLTDGKAIPPLTRLLLGREDAQDTLEAILTPDGRFKFKSIPSEGFSLSLRIKGYKLSKTNPNLDWVNGVLVGQINQDISDLLIVLEPGEWDYGKEENSAPPGTKLQPRDQPLRSSELFI
ncbi:MAG: hypothetical protein JWM99_865 [Verrucomicrobiales bacterium]|nr:hypothetical protein [Verrucomicrobiales bacterium]